MTSRDLIPTRTSFTPLPWGLIAWLMLVVLWLTWTPVRDSPPEILLRPPRMDLRALLGNLMLFAPIGAVIAASRAHDRIPNPQELRRELIVVGMSAALLSLVVEIGQLWVPGRHVSPYDVVLNSMGAVAAAWWAYRVMRSIISPRTVVALAGITTFVGVLLFVSATGYASSRMAIFSSWHAGYGVLVGDDFGGGRAYQGEISDATICGGSGDEEVCLRAGADQEERQALVDAVQNEQLLRVSAWVTSFGSQTVDARIITFSADVDHRNATLFQRDRDLILRLRTRAPGGGGSQLLLPGAIPDGVATFTEASYEPGRVRMRAVASERVTRATFPLGFFAGWWLVKEERDSRIPPRSLQFAALVAAAAFSLPLGLLAVHWTAPHLAVQILFAGALPVAVVVPLAAALVVPTPTEELVACAAFGLIGGILGSLGGARDWLGYSP